MKQSPLFSLNGSDWLKGLLMAVATPVVLIILTALQKAIAGEPLVLNWTLIGYTAAAAGLAYILKNFLTPAAPTQTVTTDGAGTTTKNVLETDAVKVDLPANAEVKKQNPAL